MFEHQCSPEVLAGGIFASHLFLKCLLQGSKIPFTIWYKFYSLFTSIFLKAKKISREHWSVTYLEKILLSLVH